MGVITSSYYSWSTNPDDNATVGNVNWAEQMPPSDVNNSSRTEMSHAAAFRLDTTGVITSGGSNNNYTVAINAVITSYFDGLTVVFKSHLRNDGAATLNVTPAGGSALGTQPLRAISGSELGAGDIPVGAMMVAHYKDGEFLLVNPAVGTVTVDNLDAHTRGLLANVGDIKPWMTDTPPDGWLLCDGQAISRSTYSQLFALWGTKFGAGNGSTTFNLIDLRGEFLRGLDTRTVGSSDPDGDSRTAPDKSATIVGRVVGSRQSWATEDHNHGQAGTGTANAGIAGGQNAVLQDGGNTSSIRVRPTSGALVDSENVSSNETRSRNVACNWIVLADAAAAGAQATYVAGLSGYRFTFKGSTQDTTQDPGIGQFTLNTTDLGTFTEIALNDQTADEGNPDVRSVIDTWGVPTGPEKGTLKLSRSAGPEIFVQATLTVTNGQTGFTRLTVNATKDGFNGAFANGESVSIDFFKATPGTPGAQGDPGVDAGGPWNFNSNTDTTQDPGVGSFTINVARNEIAIHGTNSDGSPEIQWLRSWDDSTTADDKGTLDIKLRTAPGSNFMRFRIAGPITQDNTTWLRFPVVEIGSLVGTIANGNNCSVQFARTGNEGGAAGGEANTSSNAGAGVGLALPKSGIDLPFRSLQATPAGAGASAITVAQSGGGNEVDFGFQVNGLQTATLADGDEFPYQRASAGAIVKATLLNIINFILARNNRWTAGQVNEVTEIATWSTAWDSANSQSFNITAQVSGAAGNLPVPASTHLVNGSGTVGVITLTTAAGNTAGFDAGWQIPSVVSTDISAAGDYEITFRVWRNSAGTTVNRINAIAKFT